ncbi:hypothetical protein ACBQ54_11055 [Providencia vermicola]|nr:hypothetical protein [Providencia sp. PROV259]
MLSFLIGIMLSKVLSEKYEAIGNDIYNGNNEMGSLLPILDLHQEMFN